MPTSQDKICDGGGPHLDLLHFRFYRLTALLFPHGVEEGAKEDRVIHRTLYVAGLKAMAGSRCQQEGRDLLEVQRIRLFIDRLAFLRIGRRYTAVENVLELSQQFLR